MEFRILGPLSVFEADQELLVSGAQRRAVLALLLVHANEVVSADALIDALWDGEPPKSASTTLQTYVYQLRKTLELDALLTRPTGYELEIEPDSLDALRFERVVDAVGRARHPTPEWVSGQLREALGWWRGRALADFEGAAWAQPETTRLETLRLAAVEDLMDARLALGEHAAVVPELESLVADHPLRERLWAQLMLALYRSDRQADALRAYSRLRATLGEELGIEPGTDVTQLETSILRHDPALDLVAPRADAAPVVTADPQPAPASPPTSRDSRAHRRRLGVVAIAAVVVAALVIAGLTLVGGSDDSGSAVPAPEGYQPRYRTTQCPATIRQTDATARCGELTVPEDRSRPQGRSVRLGVYRFPALSSHPTADPVVQVPGDFRLVEPASDGILRARSDSIYLAGRGFFGSHPRLTCPGVSEAVVHALGRPVRSSESEAEFLSAVQACRARWRARGVDLEKYSATERATDVRDLAVALGIEKINLLAGRDSTAEAHRIAGLYPGLVRSVLLVNVTPPQANRWNGAITNTAGAFDRYAADCSAQPACADVYPDIEGQLESVYARSRDAPTTYLTADPRGPGRPLIPVVLDGDRSVQIATLALDDPRALPLVAAATTGAPGSGQAAVDYGTSHLVTPDDASWGALLSKMCRDESSSLALEGIGIEADASPEFAHISVDPLLDACPVWGTPASRADTPSPVAIPTLILEGALDPYTSTEWADATARSFGHATVVQLPHLGDVALSGDACVTSLRARFLSRPGRRISSRACRTQIAPIHFAGT